MSVQCLHSVVTMLDAMRPFSRLSLTALVRKLGRKASTTDRLEVAEKRERLQARIDKFHRQATEFWPPHSNDMRLHDPGREGGENLASSDTEDDSDDDVFEDGPSEDLDLPERQPLLLPSNLGLDVCQEQGYMAFVEQEKTLRVGQANDALQGLRLGLSKKAVIFRKGVRLAKTKTRKLRSWDQISMVDVNVRHHARVYAGARAAMIRLGACEEDLERYQTLRKEHLSVTTAQIDPSLRGQRDTSLAWFWTVDVKRDMDERNGMEECRCL